MLEYELWYRVGVWESLAYIALFLSTVSVLWFLVAFTSQSQLKKANRLSLSTLEHLSK